MINELKNLLLGTGYFRDNEYLDTYVNLLSNYDASQPGYKERHHVVPTAVYRYKYKCENSLEGRKLADADEKNYIISILYKDHILAHYLLCFCAIGHIKYSMARAVVNMVGKLDIQQLDLTEFKYLPEQFEKVQQLIDCIKADPDTDFYTPDEIEFLKLYYKEKGPTFCAEQLNKTYNAIRAKAHSLRITREAHKAWTDEEIQIVKQYYEEYGLAYCRTLLPNRPNGSILDLAKRLGLSTGRVWNVDEEKFLIENYTKLGGKKCAEILNRSFNSVKHKAATFKLKAPRNWTAEEVDILLQHYNSEGVDYCVKLLNRERCAIQAKARKLGIADTRSENWREDEIEFLLNNYEKYGLKFCVEALPGRTELAVSTRVQKLGLSRAPESWSEEDLEFLKQNYEQYGAKFCAEHLPTRTIQAVSLRARKLGLRVKNKHK